MQNNHFALHALIDLHKTIGGEILRNKEQAKELAEKMKHIEAVLQMLDPGFNLRPIAVRRRRPNPWFKRGTVFRSALDVLRTAQEPLTVSEIADRMLQAKGVEERPVEAIRHLWGAIQSSLRNHKGGRVVAHEGRSPVRWSLTD